MEALETAPGSRINELSKPKTTVSEWQPHRPSPMWAVSQRAMSATPSTRVIQLSAHKQPHQEYLIDRDPIWKVRRPALSWQPSPRLLQLALPRKREDLWSCCEPHWGFCYPVSASALKANSTERLNVLAHHKEFHKNFKDARPIPWEMSRAAVTATASLRLTQLALPCPRALLRGDCDPHKVSRSAMNARTTPRLEELALPLPRKVTQKIVLAK